ncbi:MAG: sulfite exporter TauE/SafE family protein [Bacteroides sp.]|nr:sulfite exporter TauE/SafE family protein [Bacteroides sp.]
MYEAVICIIAGLGAGLGTGFAGMSAAAVISPMLITFLNADPYAAVGIALASDVLASAASAWTYKKNKNIDVKNGIVMMICVLLFTVAGSWVSSLLPTTVMGGFSTFMTMILGIKFIIKPVVATKESMSAVSVKKRIVQSVIGGSAVGFICGFVGAGGGMMMLMLLTVIMGYELKTAVGTSVFVMAFTALTGSVSHFAIGGLPDPIQLAVCAASTLVFALIASKIANKAKPAVLNRVVGVILLILGIAILTVNLIE